MPIRPRRMGQHNRDAEDLAIEDIIPQPEVAEEEESDLTPTQVTRHMKTSGGGVRVRKPPAPEPEYRQEGKNGVVRRVSERGKALRGETDYPGEEFGRQPAEARKEAARELSEEELEGRTAVERGRLTKKEKKAWERADLEYKQRVAREKEEAQFKSIPDQLREKAQRVKKRIGEVYAEGELGSRVQPEVYFPKTKEEAIANVKQNISQLGKTFKEEFHEDIARPASLLGRKAARYIIDPDYQRKVDLGAVYGKRAASLMAGLEAKNYNLKTDLVRAETRQDIKEIVRLRNEIDTNKKIIEDIKKEAKAFGFEGGIAKLQEKAEFVEKEFVTKNLRPDTVGLIRQVTGRRYAPEWIPTGGVPVVVRKGKITNYLTGKKIGSTSDMIRNPNKNERADDGTRYYDIQTGEEIAVDTSGYGIFGSMSETLRESGRDKEADLLEAMDRADRIKRGVGGEVEPAIAPPYEGIGDGSASKDILGGRTSYAPASPYAAVEGGLMPAYAPAYTEEEKAIDNFPETRPSPYAAMERRPAPYQQMFSGQNPFMRGGAPSEMLYRGTPSEQLFAPEPPTRRDGDLSVHESGMFSRTVEGEENKRNRLAVLYGASAEAFGGDENRGEASPSVYLFSRPVSIEAFGGVDNEPSPSQQIFGSSAFREAFTPMGVAQPGRPGDGSAFMEAFRPSGMTQGLRGASAFEEAMRPVGVGGGVGQPIGEPQPRPMPMPQQQQIQQTRPQPTGLQYSPYKRSRRHRTSRRSRR